jgi:hypothetical protein
MRVVFAVVIALFVIAHALALQKMHAMLGPDRPAAAVTVTNGD